MRHILFYEATESATIMVEAYGENGCLWKQSMHQQALVQWMRQALREGKLQKKDQYFWLVPEDALMRQCAHFSEKATPRQQEKMAAHVFRMKYGETVGVLRLSPIAGESQVAICGVKKTYCDAHASLLGPYQRWFQWASFTEWLLVAQGGKPEAGYYAIELDRWMMIVAVVQGLVVGGRVALGASENILLEALQKELETFALPLKLNWCSTEPPAQLSPEGADYIRIGRMKGALAAGYKGDHVLLILGVICIFLPALLLLAGPPAETEPSPEEAATETAERVTHSAYSTLLAEAYTAKSERITLYNHQAADGALAISGRCAEALDVADYMKKLAQAEQDLHPILVDLTLKTEDKASFYEFVVQISFAEPVGGEAQ